ncbi:MAG TPA: TonB-dependent receptor [Candidatus Kapabacteria bacterium]|nr:TonB-dependent receptor [Candidatus Kapabacteria bacterium]
MRVLSVILLLLTCSISQAQVRDTSNHADSIKYIHSDEVVVTAQRHVTAAQDVPVSIAVVKQEELTSRSTTVIDQALRLIPGVSVTESQVNIRGSSGYGRGVGSRVLFMLDGQPMLSGDNGDIKFDILPMLSIERIEVVKGAGSSLYGSSALGGIINVITRTASDTLAVAATAIGGVYDQPKYDGWRVSQLQNRFASVEAGASGKVFSVGILGTVAVRHNEGYRLGDESDKQSGFLKVDLPVGSMTTLTASALLANEDHGGWLYWKSLSQPLLPSDSLGAVNGKIHSSKANLQASLVSVSETLSHIIHGNVYYTHFLTDASTPNDPLGPHSVAINYMLEYNLNAYLGSLFITAGALRQYQTVRSDLFTDHSGTSYALFGQGEWHLNDLILTFGARADAIGYDSSEWLGRISPKIGASYQLSDEVSLRGSFGTGFRAPAISERYIDQVFSGFPVKPNPTLQPERSYTAEIGGNYRSQYFYLDGAVFYSHFDQLIEPSFVGASIKFLNITQAEISGHEEVVEYYPFGDDRFAARIGYTYVYPKNRVTGNVLEFRPRHLFQGRISSTINDLSASVDFRYISKYESLDSVLIRTVPDGDARVNAYILDARVGYNLQPALHIPMKATFEVQNLLNYYYVEIVGNLAPLRQFSLRLETVL